MRIFLLFLFFIHINEIKLCGSICLNFLFIFNWKIVALQYCVGFYQTSTWISHRFTYVPSHLNISSHLPPHPTPLGCDHAPVWIPWVIQQIPIGYPFYYPLPILNNFTSFLFSLDESKTYHQFCQLIHNEDKIPKLFNISQPWK